MFKMKFEASFLLPQHKTFIGDDGCYHKIYKLIHNFLELHLLYYYYSIKYFHNKLITHVFNLIIHLYNYLISQLH